MALYHLSAVLRFSAAICSALFAFQASVAATPVVGEPWTIRANSTQMLGFADDLLRQGERTKAIQILDLLSHDPDPTVRNEARFRHSKLLQSEGSTTQAAVILRQILDERPDATAVRLELAQLLDQMGDKDGAFHQVRAAQAAGLPPTVARMVDRYSEALRAAKPLGASVEVSIAPDSNINHATSSDTLSTIIGDFKIDEGSKAKSGTGVALRGQVFGRLPLDESGQNLLIRLSGFADLYRKTSFNDVALDVGGGPELSFGRNRVNLEIGATQRWYGQRPYLQSVRLSTAFARPLGKQTMFWLRASASLQDNRINDLEDGKTFSGKITLEHALSPTTGLSLSLGASRDSLRDPGYSTKGWRTGILIWRDIGRATLTAEGELGRLHADDRLIIFPERRKDRSYRLTMGATFRRLTLGGFAPVARIVVERNHSSIEFHDFRRVRTEFGIVRAF